MASFSNHIDGEHFIREVKPLDMIDQFTFTQAIFYTWTGVKPDEKQSAMFDACLVALIDHGAEVLSAQAARVVASGGTEIHAAVAAGLLAAGRHHGAMVLQQVTQLFKDEVSAGRSAAEIVKEALANGKRIPGFGHRLYDTDPRAVRLLARAETLGFSDVHVKLALEIERELEKQKGKKLCLNIDGAIASLLPGLGIPPEIAPGLFLVARTVGLTMHVAEEQREKPASKRKGK
ncbi:MAG: citryl-CoA lyase [Parcubacteria group bacterium]|nr:citryl-CoA lyase [Parcubacteria group bacterium]